MAKLKRQYARSLMNLAKEQGNLEDVYNQALTLTKEDDFEIDDDMPKELRMILELLEEEDMLPTINVFIEMVRKELKIAHADVVSAVPLREEQLIDLEKKLAAIFNKRVEIVNHVDSSLLGGVRIIVDNMVIDNSIKSKLSQLKQKLYQGVNFE